MEECEFGPHQTYDGVTYPRVLEKSIFELVFSLACSFLINLYQTCIKSRDKLEFRPDLNIYFPVTCPQDRKESGMVVQCNLKILSFWTIVREYLTRSLGWPNDASYLLDYSCNILLYSKVTSSFSTFAHLEIYLEGHKNHNTPMEQVYCPLQSG